MNFSPSKNEFLPTNSDEILDEIDVLLNNLPNITLIKDGDTKSLFMNLKSKLIDIKSKSLINRKKVSEALNQAKMLMRTSAITYSCLAIEKNSDSKNIQITKDDPHLSDSLSNIKESCENLKKIGENIKNSLEYESQLKEIIETCQEISERMNIFDENAQLEKYNNQLIEMASYEFKELKEEASNIISEIKTNEKQISYAGKYSELKKKQIEYVEEEIKEFTNQLKNTKYEINRIQEAKLKIDRDFDREREDIIKNNKEETARKIGKKSEIGNALTDQMNIIEKKIIAAQEMKAQRVNYVVMIDRSGSMEKMISKVNEAACHFLEELRKFDESNFFFTIIYFDEKEYIKAETLPINSVKDFNDFLNLEADGGTNYSCGFKSCSKIVAKNFESKTIDRVAIVFFTDGEDDKTSYFKTYSFLGRMKTTYQKKILLYIRSLGLSGFSDRGQTHLYKMASIINEESESLIKLPMISAANDIEDVIIFFSRLGKMYSDYFNELYMRIDDLKKFQRKMEEEEKEIKMAQNEARDFELNDLEELRKLQKKQLPILKCGRQIWRKNSSNFKTKKPTMKLPSNNKLLTFSIQLKLWKI